MTTRKTITVMVPVEVPEPIDLDAAIECLKGLRRFKPESGYMNSLGYYTDGHTIKPNPMHTPRRPLAEVLRDDYKVDPEPIKAQMLEAVLKAANKVIPDDAERREASKRRRTAMVERLFTEAPAQVRDLARVAKIVGVSAEELAYATMGDEDAPFFSEAVLYDLFGWKDDGRTILAYLERLAKALGVDWNDLDARDPE